MNDLRNFRGPLPLTDADFARIRANVMSEVRPRRRTFFALRLAFAALLMAFAGAVSWNALRVPALELPPPSRPRPHLAVTFPVPPIPAAEEQRPVVTVRAHVAPVAAPRSTRITHQPVALAQPVRMEIQTADPNIRIIWLPNEPLEDKS
jgi:hypothetical protein